METSTLSPKETIINILGRLFNNGHISHDELSIMQHELLVNNPPPAEPKGPEIPSGLVEQMVRDFFNKSGGASTFPPPPGAYMSNPYAEPDAVRHRRKEMERQAALGSKAYHGSDVSHSLKTSPEMLRMLSTYADINDLKP